VAGMLRQTVPVSGMVGKRIAECEVRLACPKDIVGSKEVVVVVKEASCRLGS
jgi:hypothetical protein